MRPGSMALWILVYGVLWNGLGWVGNNLLLEADWNALGASLAPDFSPPYSGLAREAMTLVPDLLFAVMFVWLFAQFRTQTVRSALLLGFILWIGVVITYLAIVTSGFLPWEIAAKTSVLALVIFLGTAPLLPLATRRKERN